MYASIASLAISLIPAVARFAAHGIFGENMLNTVWLLQNSHHRFLRCWRYLLIWNTEDLFWKKSEINICFRSRVIRDF